MPIITEVLIGNKTCLVKRDTTGDWVFYALNEKAAMICYLAGSMEAVQLEDDLKNEIDQWRGRVLKIMSGSGPDDGDFLK